MKTKRHLNKTATNLSLTWLRLLGQARTRILIWYLVLMAFFVAVAIPTIRQRLFTRVENRVRDELTEEVEGFRELLMSEFTFTKGAVWERLQKEYGVRQSYSKQQKLSALFDVYLSRELTEDDTFLITFINGRYNKASSRALPELLRRDSEFLESLAKVRQPIRGEKQVPDPSIGNILYKIEPVNIEGKILGVLIVAHVTAGERAEALEAFKVVIEVKIAVLALALVLSWFAAGKILSPLQLLAATARSIALGSKIVNGKVHFWVRDTGEGIETSDQQRIFERFARAAKSRRRSEGAGLGLSIVQAIAQAHGGQIHLESQPGIGSTFTIVLPLEPPQEVVSHASNSHS